MPYPKLSPLLSHSKIVGWGEGAYPTPPLPPLPLAAAVKKEFKQIMECTSEKEININFFRIGSIPPCVEIGILNITNNLGLNCTLGSI